jgi:flagellar hook protein FlgE
MLRSLSTAISGLRNHQTKLDVVGNNIANVNTVGYKSQSARFQDIFSQTLSGATAPFGGRGGINPMQVGLGMELSSINTNHSGGAITGTGVETDLAIEGTGFFVVNNGFQNYYTRDGSFTRDATGVLVNAGGMKLMGWSVGSNGDEIDATQLPGEIYIPLGEEMIAGATSEIVFTGNLDSGAETGGDPCSFPFYVYDSLGNRHELTVEFTKSGDNEWDYEFYAYDEDGDPDEVGSGTVTFTEDGKYDFDSNDPDPIDYSPGNGAFDLEIIPDFSALTQLADPSSVIAKNQNGFAPGVLTTFNIGETGVITGTYSNGMVREIAQIALASFPNPMGLIKMGSNLYDISSNSGDAHIGFPGTEGRGMLQSRALEMSNVDLANEFTEMITTSRAFQANTRVISTSDEVLVELINIKR